MVKKISISLLILTVTSILLLGGAFGWIFYTQSGTRWALNKAPEWINVDLRIGKIDGTLANNLLLEKIELTSAGISVKLDQLFLDSHLTRLFYPVLVVDKLQLTHLVVDLPDASVTKETNNPADSPLNWPVLPPILEKIQLELVDFELIDVRLRKQSQRVQIDLLQFYSHWIDGRLQLDKIVLKTPDLHGSGTAQLGLSQPLLQLDVDVETVASVNGLNQFKLHADLEPDSDTGWIKGPVTVGAEGEQVKLLSAKLDLVLSADQVVLQQLQLQQQERSGLALIEAELDLAESPRSFSGQIDFKQIDLQRELGQPLQLSGAVKLAGEVDAYAGEFDLQTLGSHLTTTKLSGVFNGNLHQLDLTDFSADWLAGVLAGQAQFNWDEGWQAQLQIEAEKLNPQLITQQLEGTINLEIEAELAAGEDGDPRGSFDIQLHDSLLHGQPLTGEALAQVDADGVQIDNLILLGQGITLKGQGNPAEKLEFSWQIEQLHQLLADSRGSFAGAGWLRWQPGELPVGVVAATGEDLSYQQWHLDQLELQGKSLTAKDSWQLHLSGEEVTQAENLLANAFALELQGSVTGHQLVLTAQRDESTLDLGLNGGWEKRQWQGSVNQLQLDDLRLGQWHLKQKSPLLLAQKHIQVDPLSFQGRGGQSIKLQGNFQPDAVTGNGVIEWQNLDLTPLNNWLPEGDISGVSDGNCTFTKGKPDHLKAEIAISGMLQQQQLKLQLAAGDVALDWQEDNLQGDIDLSFGNGGRVRGVVSADQGAVFSLPGQFYLQLDGSSFPLQIVQPWLPAGMEIVGLLDWKLEGQQQSSSGLMDLRGHAHTGAVSLSLQDADGLLSADISSSQINLQWRDQLQAQVQVTLKERGTVSGNLLLPLVSQLPLTIEAETAVAADLTADLKEMGLLSLLFPGKIDESRGELKLDLQLSGSLKNPLYQGDFQLVNAGGFLPPIGVELQNVKVAGHFNDNRVNVTAIELHSGDGRIEGKGELQLLDWKPGVYHLQLQGNNFQLINLPELQARLNSELKINGTGNKVKVRGDVELDQVKVADGDREKIAGQSSDLVIVDAEEPLAPQSPLTHDIDIQLTLGEQVLVKSAGLDAQLTGGIRLYSAANQTIAAAGKIVVAKGKFSSYGVSLAIEKGTIYFNGPVDQPALDILALRRIDEVEAGVTVAGTPQLPLVKLYSKPFMSDADILSYIVLGRPIGASGGDTNLLMTAAGALLSKGESASLQEQVKGRLGLDTLEFSSGNGDLQQSVVTTGKYLNPDLYISLGHSLFQNTNELNVRYDFTRDWQIESSIGSEESGVDLYYKFEIE
ncbi:MAG: translocation/assembly module TamB domain-containing protein [Thermodesulfobacteriota bacterium]|nr:translocation/assembly module TamB domain-containing protein [Thermodesulfobacteriota bacterium]